MLENTGKRTGRAILLILPPALCLLLVILIIGVTLRTAALDKQANEALSVYRAYMTADGLFRAGTDTLTEQARLFVYTGDIRYLNAYFTEKDTVRSRERALLEVVEAGDPFGAGDELGRLTERAREMAGTECHAMKLAALSYGLDTDTLPGELAAYPLEPGEERLNNEQKRDAANALLFGEEYCSEKSTVETETESLLALATAFADAHMDELSRRIHVSLLLQRILLGVGLLALAGLFVFAARQKKIRKTFEEARRAELQTARTRADAAERTKNAFLLNISHDIRMPINEIIGFTNIAQKHADEPERVMDSLTKTKASGMQLLNIVNDMLELSRLDNGAFEITETPADIMRTGEEIHAMLTAQAEARGVDYRMIIHPVANRYVFLDIMHMDRVLSCLIANAIKYTPAGGTVRLNVDQTSAAEQGRANFLFTVSDTGEGMSAEFVRHLFEGYAHEGDRTAGSGGKGLSLNIAKRLVDCMGGTMNVMSERGKGTVFTVNMPFRVLNKEETEQYYGIGGDSSAPEGSSYEMNGRRILVADDNELGREITAELLSAEGAVPEKAEDGGTALRLFSQKPAGYYACILLDTQMPVLNGFETAARIRALDTGRTVPIIAVAARQTEEDRVNAYAAQMNACITKPVEMRELKEVLRKFC